ncbi:hypothetical protein MG293_007843 [Ovis ammon polii]|uniref:Uncharacterized protein n=1 Tax=Ovis ammon polii TaxID=230172 RepID=A0AAD4UDY3_OVIAM|nr:hypothetical protein MG293_007843 [Ovis ammon polii]
MTCSRGMWGFPSRMVEFGDSMNISLDLLCILPHTLSVEFMFPSECQQKNHHHNGAASGIPLLATDTARESSQAHVCSPGEKGRAAQKAWEPLSEGEKENSSSLLVLIELPFSTEELIGIAVSVSPLFHRRSIHQSDKWTRRKKPLSGEEEILLKKTSPCGCFIYTSVKLTSDLVLDPRFLLSSAGTFHSPLCDSSHLLG